ncbi:MAG TPA: type III pantothenate kinase [Candidatus Polarisedimenticolia bacterium]|nr:type III pantothenate kinase [Candidatus Polarisedimenticolia bacterium]
MLLVVDVGNSHTVFGLYEEERLRADWRVQTHHGRTSDEWAVEITGLLALRGLEPRSVEAAVMSSVVPPLNGVLVEMIGTLFRAETLQVGPGVRTGIRILYDNPLEVGADRIVNSVAAFARVGGPAIVVDFGTATTFDAISAQAEYLGGIIVPGLQISADSLFSRAAKLHRVEVARPPRVIGRNTTHSIQSGLYHGYACMINGVLSLMKTEMEGTPKVLATGGLSTVLSSELSGVDVVDPHLTLEGLRLIHAKNRTT